MNTRFNAVAGIILCFSGLILSGCNTGKDSLVFATKTSYGVDIDRTPPTLDIAYGRKEGMLGPVYTNGANLPVLASFHSSASLLRNGVGQSFATGNSAELIARYLGTAATLEDSDRINADQVSGKATIAVEAGDPKRHFFGTATSFGFRVQFAEETAFMPESINLGFKRKEFAYVPLRVVGEGANRTVSLPSLVATVGFDGNAGFDTSGGDQTSKQSDTPKNTDDVTSGGSSTSVAVKATPKTEGRLNQFFATGKAADYLMARSVIRDTIGFRVIDDPDLNAKLKTRLKEEEDTFAAQIAHVGNIQRKFASVSDANKTAIRAKASQLGLVPSTISNDEFSGKLADAVDRSNNEITKNLKDLELFGNSF